MSSMRAARPSTASGSLTMTPDLLARAGRCLHGDHWQVPLSRDLGVNDRTMRHWAAGDRPIPVEIGLELIPMLRKRRQESGDLIWKLRDDFRLSGDPQ